MRFRQPAAPSSSEMPDQLCSRWSKVLHAARREVDAWTCILDMFLAFFFYFDVPAFVQ